LSESDNEHEASIERRLTLVTTLFAVGLVGGFVVLRYL
jgi:hypothetical protein